MNIDTNVECPKCNNPAEIDFVRKRGTVQINCDECSARNEYIPSYDERVVIG